MPPFGDWFICGVTTQLHLEVPNFHDLIEPSHPCATTFYLGGSHTSYCVHRDLLRNHIPANIPVSSRSCWGWSKTGL